MTSNSSLQAEASSNNRKRSATIRWFSKLVLIISTFLCAVLFLAYLFQPDFCAAVTFWPVWIWAIPGIGLSLVAIDANKKLRLVIAFIWVLLVAFIAEEPVALLRSCIYFSRDCKTACLNGNCLRVVSLNCAGGNIDTAEEIVQYAPDIVFLQESPPVKDLKSLSQKLFAEEGEFVLEGDTAILARGRVTSKIAVSEKRLFMTTSLIRLSSGLEVEALSIHLSPPVTGLNLLSPDCWREHFNDRRQRLKQIEAINDHLKLIAETVPIVVGGDFNAKVWTGAAKVFSPRLFDTFKQLGFGWSGTAPSHFPLWRVDQVWTSRHFKSIKVYSKSCKNSDHRIVICDLCRL